MWAGSRQQVLTVGDVVRQPVEPVLAHDHDGLGRLGRGERRARRARCPSARSPRAARATSARSTGAPCRPSSDRARRTCPAQRVGRARPRRTQGSRTSTPPRRRDGCWRRGRDGRGDGVPAGGSQPIEPVGEVLLRAGEPVHEQERAAAGAGLGDAQLHRASGDGSDIHSAMLARWRGIALRSWQAVRRYAAGGDRRRTAGAGPEAPAMVARGRLHPRRVHRVLARAERLRVRRRAHRSGQPHRIRPRRDHHRLAEVAGALRRARPAGLVPAPPGPRRHRILELLLRRRPLHHHGVRADLAVPPQPRRATRCGATRWPSPPCWR